MMSTFSMPQPRKIFASTLMVFFAIQQATAADISVKTTAEEMNNNGECSLQEAVAYLNRGIAESLRDTSSDCHPKDNKPTTKILLEGKKVYQVASEIKITKSMTISASNFDSLNNQNGENQPVIKTTGERIFVIDDGKPSQENVAVLMQGFRLHGPYIDSVTLPSESAASVQDEGGLIFNREKLSVSQMKFRGGAAKKGGAIYNASSDASLNIKNVEISNNFSNLGAAVFSEFANMSLQQSLVKQNRPLDANQQGFAVEVEKTTPTISEIQADPENKDKPIDLKPSRLVTNTIFYDNQVGVMTIKPGMFVNNITAIENKTGVDFETGFDVINPDNRQIVSAKLSNSVILNSDEYDLKVPEKDFTFVNNVVVQKNRIVNAAGVRTDVKPQYQDGLSKLDTVDGLIAFERDINNQKKKDVNGAFVCQPPTLDFEKDKGLFCPLIQLEDEYFETLKPRLLMSYIKLDESPIVNKGKGASDSSPNSLSESCEVIDVRGQNRGLCDIGAFELVIDKSDAGSKSVNAEISFGEVATLVLKDAVGDGQLLPDQVDPKTGKHVCESYVLNAPTDPALWPSGKVGTWSPGCLLYTRSDKAPKKGTVKISESADGLIYTPSSNFHGFDQFQYRIVTTTSRFSESPNNRALVVDSKVNQSPPDNFQSTTINLGYGSGSGSFGWFELLAIMLLSISSFGYNRRRQSSHG